MVLVGVGRQGGRGARVMWMSVCRESQWRGGKARKEMGLCVLEIVVPERGGR